MLRREAHEVGASWNSARVICKMQIQLRSFAKRVGVEKALPKAKNVNVEGEQRSWRKCVVTSEAGLWMLCRCSTILWRSGGTLRCIVATVASEPPLYNIDYKFFDVTTCMW